MKMSVLVLMYSVLSWQAFSAAVYTDDFNDNTMGDDWSLCYVVDGCAEDDVVLNETSQHLQFTGAQ